MGIFARLRRDEHKPSVVGDEFVYCNRDVTPFYNHFSVALVAWRKLEGESLNLDLMDAPFLAEYFHQVGIGEKFVDGDEGRNITASVMADHQPATLNLQIPERSVKVADFHLAVEAIAQHYDRLLAKQRGKVAAQPDHPPGDDGQEYKQRNEPAARLFSQRFVYRLNFGHVDIPRAPVRLVFRLSGWLQAAWYHRNWDVGSEGSRVSNWLRAVFWLQRAAF